MEQDRYAFKFDGKVDTKAGSQERTEMMAGAQGHRTWSAQDKLAIVIESMVDGVVISDVARKHGLAPQQLFSWRWQFKARKAELLKHHTPDFARAVLDDSDVHDQELPTKPARLAPHPAPCGCQGGLGMTGHTGSSIEITIGRAGIVIRGAVDQGTVATVLKTLAGLA